MIKTQHGIVNQSTIASGLESKVPPVALTAITASVMYLASLSAPAFDFTLPANTLCAMGLALGGVLTSLAGVLSFHRAKTTVNPSKPELASALVASTIYKHSRNPMYLGFAMILLGWGLALSNALALLVLPWFVLYMDRFQIRPEERALFSRFGQDYREYYSRVRRWM